MNGITKKETRKMIYNLSREGLSSSIIAEQLGLGLSVVKKWRSRGAKGDFGKQMGRPSHPPLGSYPKELVDKIRDLRKAHPGWGPRHLVLAMRKMPVYSTAELPSISSISRFLSSEGLSRRYREHGGIEGKPFIKASSIHQHWQMDAEGNTAMGKIGTVSIINLKDCYSRTHVMSYPAIVSSPQGHPTTDDYQTTLRAGFVQHGKPQSLQVDHESVFYDNKSPSPFPTRLHLWLMALGITLQYSRFKTPTDQGIIERTHQTIHNQAIKGQQFQDWEQLVYSLDQRRHILNHEAPCESLNKKAPFEAFPHAKYPQIPFDIGAEEEELKLERIYQQLEPLTWIRSLSKAKTLSLGKKTYYLKHAVPKKEVLISFDLNRKKLAFAQKNEKNIQYMPIRELSTQWLMGKNINQSRWPQYQLRLPITNNFQMYNYQLRLFDTLKLRLNET